MCYSMYFKYHIDFFQLNYETSKKCVLAKFPKFAQLYVMCQNLEGHISLLICCQWNFSGKFGKSHNTARHQGQLCLKQIRSLEEAYTTVISTVTPVGNVGTNKVLQMTQEIAEYPGHTYKTLHVDTKLCKETAAETPCSSEHLEETTKSGVNVKASSCCSELAQKQQIE